MNKLPQKLHTEFLHMCDPLEGFIIDLCLFCYRSHTDLIMLALEDILVSLRL